MTAPADDAVRLSEALAMIDGVRDALLGLSTLLDRHDQREDAPAPHQIAALISHAAAPLAEVLDLFGAGPCGEGG